MAELGFELVLRFIWGALVLLTLVSRKETTERFPRIAAWICVGIALFGAWLLHGSKLPFLTNLAALASLTVGSLLYAYTVPRFTRTLGFALSLLAPLFFLWGRPAGAWVNFGASGLLFGSVFVGQYLGHWFLTVPGLNIHELQKVVRALFIALALRSGEVIYTLFVSVGLQVHSDIDPMGRPLGIDLSATGSNVGDLTAAHSLLGLSGDSWFGLGFFGLLMLATRLLWGIFAPIILSVMIKKTVDTRSTQSATGIFYALSVMILLGEGTALYLKNTLGWFL